MEREFNIEPRYNCETYKDYYNRIYDLCKHFKKKPVEFLGGKFWTFYIKGQECSAGKNEVIFGKSDIN